MERLRKLNLFFEFEEQRFAESNNVSLILGDHQKISNLNNEIVDTDIQNQMQCLNDRLAKRSLRKSKCCNKY